MDHSTARLNGRPDRFDADVAFDQLGDALQRIDSDRARLRRRVRRLSRLAVPAALLVGVLLGAAAYALAVSSL